MLIMESSHPVPLGHYTAAVAGRVETAGDNAAEDDNSEHDGKGDDEGEVGGFSGTWDAG